jgi:hypothetical protein
VLENKVEAAYRRSNRFEKRRQLLDEWAKFVDKVHLNSEQLERP